MKRPDNVPKATRPRNTTTRSRTLALCLFVLLATLAACGAPGPQSPSAASWDTASWDATNWQ